MLKDPSPTVRIARLAITSTAFRDDRTAELVTISELSFDHCCFSSSAEFAVGERLRLHMHGQGWIEVEVESSSDGEVRSALITRSRC